MFYIKNLPLFHIFLSPGWVILIYKSNVLFSSSTSVHLKAPKPNTNTDGREVLPHFFLHAIHISRVRAPSSLQEQKAKKPFTSLLISCTMRQYKSTRKASLFLIRLLRKQGRSCARAEQKAASGRRTSAAGRCIKYGRDRRRIYIHRRCAQRASDQLRSTPERNPRPPTPPRGRKRPKV